MHFVQSVIERLGIVEGQITDVESRPGKLYDALDTVDLHEQRSFLKSFVEKIEVDDEKAKMYYTIPVPSGSISQETTGVLPFVHHG